METMTPRAFLSFLNGRIGSKVLLFNEAGLYKGTYPSRVEDVKGDLIGLSHPLLRGALLPVLRNVELKLKVETDGALYQTTVSVARGGPQDGVPVLWVSPVSNAERVQRRYFVRVPCLLKTSFFRLEGEGIKAETEEWTHAVSRDISLGGVGVLMPLPLSERFAEQDRVLVRLPLQDGTFYLSGKVARKLRKEDVWEIGFAFESMPGSVEKPLGAFIRQQELAGRQ
jgi:c-di-GMP-binding flagellar brake protein YcgR